jgi:hypothetical protein
LSECGGVNIIVLLGGVVLWLGESVEAWLSESVGVGQDIRVGISFVFMLLHRNRGHQSGEFHRGHTPHID